MSVRGCDRSAVGGRWARAAVLLAAGLCAAPSASGAEASPRELVREGNEQYRSGEYAGAAERYDKAKAGDPKMLEAVFNRACAAFKQGEFDEAERLFRQVDASPGAENLAARARYNLGLLELSRVQQKEAATQGKLEDVVEGFKRGAAQFRSALDLDPKDADAARNLELARQMIRKGEDALERQKQINEQLEELAKQLEQTQKDQQQQADKSGKREQQKRRQQEQKQQEQADQPEGEQNTAQQQQDSQPSQPNKDVASGSQGESGEQRESSEEQGKVSRQTEQARRDLEAVRRELQEQPAEPAGASGDPSLDEAAQALERARAEQQEAEEHLKRQDDAAAGESQQAAADELKKALEELRKRQEQQQGGEKGDKGEPQDKNQEQGKEDQQGEGQEEQQQAEQDQGQDAGAGSQAGQDGDQATDRTVASILNKEKRDRERREAVRQAQIQRNRAVDKDW